MFLYNYRVVFILVPVHGASIYNAIQNSKIFDHTPVHNSI